VLDPARPGRFRWYLGGVGSGAVAMGLQVVLFPWILVGVLHETPARVGLAQTAVLVPSLLLILLGGAISDNRHLGTYVRRLFLLYVLPCGLLLWAGLTARLDYPLLLLFGVCYGTITAFVQPAREALLPQVYAGNIQQSVAQSTFVQFAAQSVGIVAAGQFDRIGLPLLLLVQMVMFVIAGNLFRRAQPAHEGLQTGRRREPLGVASGFATVWRLPGLRALMAVVSITGFFGFGAYLVAVPLMIREIYQGGAGLFSLVQLCFTLGVLSANLLFMRRGSSLGRPGRALIASLFGRGIVLAVLAFHLPLWALFPAVVVWGIFSGMAITLGRVLTHTQAPDSHRSRVVSIYQLAFFGTAPLGAWLTGQIIAGFGVLPALAALGGCTLIASVLATFTPVWRAGSGRRSAPP
jgi:MFS family permease